MNLPGSEVACGLVSAHRAGFPCNRKKPLGLHCWLPPARPSPDLPTQTRDEPELFRRHNDNRYYIWRARWGQVVSVF